MEISSELLKVLVCPITKGPLIYDREAEELISEMAGLAFPVRNGIPVLLVEEARAINKNAYSNQSKKADYITSSEEGEKENQDGAGEVA
jgi:uncharacterized protein YbaR (Trm112 family)